LAELGSATLGESGGQTADASLKPAWPGARVAAPAFTVSCAPGDNLAVHVAVAEASAGSVLAVDVGGRGGYGYWGEVLTTAAESRGIVGLVIGGGVRDVTALEAHAFPVFSTEVALAGASKIGPGSVGAPVHIAGIDVRTGDWIVGDADGVVVIAREQLDAVLAAGRARADKEQGYFERLRAGATTVELLALDTASITRS
jgi:4-hydroxy-4-methyl-2-oxoglutarate aldolase